MTHPNYTDKKLKIHIKKISNERGDITTNFTKIKKMIRNTMNSCMLTNQITQIKGFIPKGT